MGLVSIMPEGKKGVLTVDKSNPQSKELSFGRIINLSVVVYNLQDVSDFEQLVDIGAAWTFH